MAFATIHYYVYCVLYSCSQKDQIKFFIRVNEYELIDVEIHVTSCKLMHPILHLLFAVQ